MSQALSVMPDDGPVGMPGTEGGLRDLTLMSGEAQKDGENHREGGGRAGRPQSQGVPESAPTVSVAVVGLGYVGLPTALAYVEDELTVHGVDINARRVEAVRTAAVDLLPADHERLRRALDGDLFHLGTDPSVLRDADVVIICVPTPLDRHLGPDLGPVRGACETVVRNARAGQTIVLTSTSYAGTTRELLVEPLARRGFAIGQDIFVAFSPERIDPGVPQHAQSTTPRVVGGATPACAARAEAVLGRLTGGLHRVSTPEAAEMTKLYENTFRAVTLALANEFADICATLSLDPVEVTIAAATKPYGFLAVFPGPGVGGHCIPCDPHYLLWQLRGERGRAPVTEQAMASIAARPQRVVHRALEVMSDRGTGLRDARVVVVGVAYKPGVQDLRESSALEILQQLKYYGARVAYHDPLVPELVLPDGTRLVHEASPEETAWDLALLHTLHPGRDYRWVHGCAQVLDGTYRFDRSAVHAVV